MRQLKDTNGLLIDVRDNPGGLINLADYIPQLFGSNIESVKGNFKVNSINNALVKNTFSKSDIWFNSYYKRKWFSKFSSPVEFTSKRYVNYVGQAYIKPVAVLVNARCFSSCDIFAANMKDNGVALVFGEDESTGGGGANVVGYNNFLNEKGSETFPRMPFSNLPSAQDITVAWRQVSRVKKSLGKLIEDYGVEVDQVVKPRTLDFVDGKSNSQYDYIAKKLLQVGIETKRNQMYFNLAPTYELNAVVGDTVSIAFTCQGIQRVEIVDAESNSILITKSMNTTKAEKSKSQIQFNASSNPGYKKIILNAYDDNLKLVFSTARMIRYTPQQRLQLLANETRQLDWVSNYTIEYLTDIRPYAELQQTKWTRSSTVLGINGYSDYANTRITWFLNVENLSSIELEVDVSYATEIDADYLRISYTSMFGTQQLLGSYTQINGLFVDGISGNGRLTRKFTLSDLDSVTEISIEFISDENTVGKGVFVHKMQLKT